MKKLITLILSLVLVCLPALALQKQVTTVSASSTTIFTPGQFCLWVTIANTGSGAVWLSFDGTAATSSGFPLAAGSSITVVYGGGGQKGLIKAILQTATTTTLNINTPEIGSS